MSNPLQIVRPARNEPNLPLDPDEATCNLLRDLTGGTLPTESEFQNLIERNRALVEAPAREIRESLARQALLLEGIWMHYVSRALHCKRDDHAALLQKTALACQASLNRTLGAISTLDNDAKDQAAIES